jgi:hypothetical protein
MFIKKHTRLDYQKNITGKKHNQGCLLKIRPRRGEGILYLKMLFGGRRDYENVGKLQKTKERVVTKGK